MSIGTTERGYTTKSGQQIPDRTEWHDVILWRQVADYAERFCRKGTQVFVQGKLRHRTYTDNNNQTRYVTEIETTDFQILDRPTQNQPQNQPQYPQMGQQYAQGVSAAPAPNYAPQGGYGAAFAPDMPNDDDMPF